MQHQLPSSLCTFPLLNVSGSGDMEVLENRLGDVQQEGMKEISCSYKEGRYLSNFPVAREGRD